MEEGTRKISESRPDDIRKVRRLTLRSLEGDEKDFKRGEWTSVITEAKVLRTV
jgi:hypothetical protein